MSIVRLRQQLRPQVLETICQYPPFLFRHHQRLGGGITEEPVAAHLSPEKRIMQQFRVEKQRPATDTDSLTRVRTATYLPGRDAHQCVLRHLVSHRPVCQLRQLALVEKHPIHLVTVQAVTHARQLVIMNHAD